MNSLSTISAFCVCIATSSQAALCEVRTRCAPNTDCDTEILLMTWAADKPEELVVDGVRYSVRRITADTVLDTIQTADTTWTISTEGPALLIDEPGYFGSIHPSDDMGGVSLNIGKSPTQYVSYAEALELRFTYDGHCEGLF